MKKNLNRSTLVDALLAEIATENEVQGIILHLLETATDGSLNLKKLNPDDVVPKWERTRGSPDMVLGPGAHFDGGEMGFSGQNFDQALKTLKNKNVVRVYRMTAADGTRGYMVAFRGGGKRNTVDYEELHGFQGLVPAGCVSYFRQRRPDDPH